MSRGAFLLLLLLVCRAVSAQSGTAALRLQIDGYSLNAARPADFAWDDTGPSIDVTGRAFYSNGVLYMLAEVYESDGTPHTLKTVITLDGDELAIEISEVGGAVLYDGPPAVHSDVTVVFPNVGPLIYSETGEAPYLHLWALETLFVGAGGGGSGLTEAEDGEPEAPTLEEPEFADIGLSERIANLLGETVEEFDLDELGTGLPDKRIITPLLNHGNNVEFYLSWDFYTTTVELVPGVDVSIQLLVTWALTTFATILAGHFIYEGVFE